MRVACIGVGGQGWFNLRAIARHAEIAGLCDVDKVTLLRASKTYPSARTSTDYRALFVAHQEFDAVAISTPDHTHGEMIRLALSYDKHCFCEKPLAARLEDLDSITKLASVRSSVTCLGCQGVYGARFDYIRRWLSESVIGELQELTVWTDRPGNHWIPSPERLSVSGEVEWSRWLGSAPDLQCLQKDVHPLGWRHYLAYGTGATGDMGPHLLSLPFLAFAICGVSWIRVINSERPVNHCFPASLHLQASLQTRAKGDILLNWYHGGIAPNHKMFNSVRRSENGILIHGKSATLYCAEWNIANAFLYRNKKISRIYDGLDLPARPDMFQQWIASCASKAVLETDFLRCGIPLTSIILKLVEEQRTIAST